jgi:quercetin dioxygenase-like cupin family protein
MMKNTSDDAVTVAPHVHKTLFKTERVRVLDVTVKPGDVAKMHSHPENIVVVLEGGKLEFTGENGIKKEAVLGKDAVLHNQAGRHAVANKGPDTIRVIQIELQ